MLKELLNDHQLFHSEFQQDNYITIRAGGTLYGQYKQSLRELYKRVRGLREAYCDKKKLEIEIKEYDKKRKQRWKGFKAKYAQVEFERKSMQMEEVIRLIKDTQREYSRFYQQAVYLKSQIGELTPERRRELDEDMHIFKIKEMAVVDFVTRGRLGNSTYEFINAIPIDKRKKLLDEIKNHDLLINWYENRSDNYLKELPDIESEIDIQFLLEDGG